MTQMTSTSERQTDRIVAAYTALCSRNRVALVLLVHAEMSHVVDLM